MKQLTDAQRQEAINLHRQAADDHSEAARHHKDSADHHEQLRPIDAHNSTKSAQDYSNKAAATTDSASRTSAE